MMMTENKAPKDMKLAYWMFTAGVGYRLVLRDKAEAFMEEEDMDEAPFELYTLDPRNTFVVRQNDVSKKVVMAVAYAFLPGQRVAYTVYTKNKTYYIYGSQLRAEHISEIQVHNFGMIPIVEYPCNSLRMGAFEIVIDLLDAINLSSLSRP